VVAVNKGQTSVGLGQFFRQWKKKDFFFKDGFEKSLPRLASTS
jgi:hypothetical protein